MEDVTKKEPEQLFAYNEREYKASDDIAFFSQELYIFKLENNLLGDYDSLGKYVLPSETFKGLSELKKTITKKENQQLFLKAECTSREFKFSVKVFEPNKTQKVAQLYLIETLSSVLHKGKEIVSLIANYIDDNDAFFEEKYKKVFNIIPDSEDGKKDENEIILKALLEKLKFEAAIYENYLLQTKQKDKTYVEKLLKSLAADQAGYAVLKKYEALLAKYGISIKPSDKNYYRILKQLLDEAIEEERKTLSGNLNLLILRLRQSYVKSNAPIIETLKTAVVGKVKEIEKSIKLGKGAGQPKFSYYKGVTTKKRSPQKRKKHPNLESIKKQNKSKLAEKDATQNAVKLEDLVGTFLKKSFLFESPSAEKNIEKSEEVAKTFNQEFEKAAVIAKQELVRQTIESNALPRVKEKFDITSKPKPKAKEKEKAKQKVDSRSMFGRVFGDS